MDDFTKKDKYASINSAIKEVVSQNNNLYQKALAEKYGFKQEQTNEEVVHLDESVIERVRRVYKQIKNRDLLQQRSDLKYLLYLEAWGEDYWCNIGKMETEHGRGQTAENNGADPKEAAAYCKQHRSEKSKFQKELDAVEKQLTEKLGSDWERKYRTSTRKQILDVLSGD